MMIVYPDVSYKLKMRQALETARVGYLNLMATGCVYMTDK